MSSLFHRLQQYRDTYGRGRRRLVVERLEDRLTPSGGTFTTSPAFTLPAGRGITIQYDAVVDSPLAKGVTQVFNQGTVSGTGFATFKTDAQPVPGSADPVATTVDRAPEVTAVYVRGSSWSAAFMAGLQSNGLGDAKFGFAVPAGATQTAPLPWTNIDRVSVRFSRDVVVGPGDLTLFGT